MNNKFKTWLQANTWLVSRTPVSTHGHTLVIFPFTKYQFAIPFVTFNDNSWIVTKLNITPEY